MPRVGDVYTVPTGTDAVSNGSISSTAYNAFLRDMETWVGNGARPVSVGGTGASTAAGARANLKAEVTALGQIVSNYDTQVWESGGFASNPGAFNSPDGAGAATNFYIGTAQVTSADSVTLTARNGSTGATFQRQKWGGVWSAWYGGKLAGDLEIEKSAPQLIIDATPAASGAAIVMQQAGAARWGWRMEATATGHLFLDRYNPAGTLASSPISVDVTTGTVAIPAAPTAGAHAANKTYVDGQDALRVAKAGDTMTGQLTLGYTGPVISFAQGDVTGGSYIQSTVGGLLRWRFFFGDGAAESGANAGTNMQLNAYTDAGAVLRTQYSINRKSGFMWNRGSYMCNGMLEVNGGGGWAFGWQQNGTDAFYCGRTGGDGVTLIGNIFQIGTTLIASSVQAYKPGGGPWIDPSDARIKNVIGDYTQGLDQVLALNPIRFTFKGNDQPPEGTGPIMAVPEQRDTLPYPDSPHREAAVSGKEYVGLIAQEVEGPFPEMVSQRTAKIDGVEVTDLRDLDTTPLIFALVNAVKTLAARVEALEAS